MGVGRCTWLNMGLYHEVLDCRFRVGWGSGCAATAGVGFSLGSGWNGCATGLRRLGIGVPPAGDVPVRLMVDSLLQGIVSL